MTLPLIVLRPAPAASETVARAAALGIEARSVPLFVVQPVEWRTPAGQWDGLLLTSANAVRHAGEGLSALAGLPAHCVGGATGVAAREAGLMVATIGAGNAQALVSGLHPGRYLWLSGEERTALAPPEGVTVVPLPVYSAAPPPVDARALAGPAVVLVHSARAAQRLGQIAPERAALQLVAMSENVAGLCGHGWASVTASPEPTDGAMVEIGTKLCQEAANGRFRPD